MFCTNCGSKINLSDVFCSSCGLKLYSAKQTNQNKQADELILHINEYSNNFDKLMQIKSNFDTENSIIKKVYLLEKMIQQIYGLKGLKEIYNLNTPPLEDLQNSFLDFRKSYMEYFESGESGYKFLHTKIVGVTFHNEEGRNRQELLQYMNEGEILYLNTSEYEGKPCICVNNFCGEKLGHLNRDLAKDFYDKVINNKIIICFARNITGDYYINNLGCNLLIVFND